MIDREELAKLAKNIQARAFQRGYVSAFTLAAYPVPTDEELTIRITRECDGLVYGNAEVGSREAFKVCIEELDGKVDYIFVDTSLTLALSPVTKKEFEPELPLKPTWKFKINKFKPVKSVLLTYIDTQVWIDSVFYTISALDADFQNKKLCIITIDEAIVKNRAVIYLRLIDKLFSAGVMFAKHFCIDTSGIDKSLDDDGITGWEKLEKYNEEKKKYIEEMTQGKPLESADILIGASIYQPCITVDHIKKTGKKPLIVDAGIGTITPEASEYARKNGLKMIRVDNRAAMAGTLFSLIQSHDLVTRVMGEGEIDGVKIVAGGIVGPPGSVIVDTIDYPSMVIGIADGTGKVIYEPNDPSHIEALKKVKAAIEKGESNG